MNYTAVPNWLIDQANSLPSAAFKVAVVICRLTVGWQKDTDEIAIGRLRDLTGLSKPTIISALRDLDKAGIVEYVGPGRRGMGVYRLVKFLDRSNFFTGQETLPDAVKELDRSTDFSPGESARAVKEFDTQKKEYTTPSGVVAAQVNDESESAEVNGQLSLVGLPEPPPPVAPAPSPAEPEKPKRPRNPPAPAEVKALYAPMFDLTKTVRSGKAAMGVYTKCAALWREFSVTPEQVAAFWDWFKVFSPAAQFAARERRPVNPPMPRQVHELWPQFLPWWEAKQAQAARDAERRAAEEAHAAARQAQDEPQAISGREMYRRTFGLPRRDPTLTAD